MRPLPLCLLIALLVLAGPAAGQSETAWQTHNAAGILAFEDGNHQEAVRYFETAYASAEAAGVVDPKLGALLNNLAAVYLTLGRPAEAREVLGRWTALLGRNQDKAWAVAQSESLATAAALLERKLAEAGTQTTSAATSATVAATGPATVAATVAMQPERRYAVQLASLPTFEDVEAETQRLRRRHSQVLDARQTFTREAEVTGGGTLWRLFVGPFGSPVTARNVCRYFERQQQGCIVVELDQDD